MVKYAGADWVTRQGERIVFSPLGMVVADILGQVYRGIYHIDSAVYSKKAQWSGETISIPLGGGIATYDRDDLTTLVFCCFSAGVEVEVEGASNHYLRFNFKKAQGLTLDTLRKQEAAQGAGFSPNSSLSVMTAIKKASPTDREVLFSLQNSISFASLAELVIFAHRLLKRVEIKPLSRQSVKIIMSQREKSDSIFANHRNCDEMWQDMIKFYEPLLPEHSELTRQLHAS